MTSEEIATLAAIALRVAARRAGVELSKQPEDEQKEAA